MDRRRDLALYDEAIALADDLYAFARRLTGDDAEDLVQETYTRALAGLGGFTAGTNLRAWLLRILRNAWIDQLRRRRVDPTDRDAALDDDAAPPADAGALDRLRTVDRIDVTAAMAALPAVAREVVLLDLEGLSEAEVAGVLGVPVGTVKSRLSRARAALRRHLEDRAR